MLSLGQDKFHREISDTLEFVVKQSDVIVENLRNVTEYLSVAQIVIPEDEQHQIEELNENLIRAANELEEITSDSADKIQKALDVARCLNCGCGCDDSLSSSWPFTGGSWFPTYYLHIGCHWMVACRGYIHSVWGIYCSQQCYYRCMRGNARVGGPPQCGYYSRQYSSLRR